MIDESKSMKMWEEIKISPLLGRINSETNVIHKKDKVLKFQVFFEELENRNIKVNSGIINRNISYYLRLSLN
jgi:hypothetical protein